MSRETDGKHTSSPDVEGTAPGKDLNSAAEGASRPLRTNALSSGLRRILRRGGEKDPKMGRAAGRKHALRPEEEKKTFGEGMNFAAAEAYRLLRTNVLFTLPFSSLSKGQTCRVIGITSSLSGEGKSTTAMNLAYVLAESKRRVLLMETDMRLPTISRRLGLEKKEGLSNLLAGLLEEDEILQPSGLQENLWVVGAGETPPNPSELLGSGQMRDAIDCYSSAFDFIILDLPPVNEVSDALVVSRLTHGMIMVVRQGYVTRSSLAAAMRQLSYVEAKILGFVMTYTDMQGGKYKSYYKGKYSDASKRAAQ